jgi:hypothetical protein
LFKQCAGFFFQVPDALFLFQYLIRLAKFVQKLRMKIVKTNKKVRRLIRIILSL